MTILFAHRGASKLAPENTLEAFRLGLAHGATAIETDAWMTRDRVVRRAKLALYPAGSSKAKVVEIAPPNKLTYDRRTYDAVVREFLFARGFLRHPRAHAAPLRAMG